MDFSQLANDIVTYAAPALPYLVQVSEKALDVFKGTVGKKLGERGAKLLFALWDKVGDKLTSPKAAMDPARRLAAYPYDESAKQEFRDQVLAHLREDPGWAEEVSGIVVQCKELNITVTVNGDIVVGDKVGGNKITGDVAGGNIFKDSEVHIHEEGETAKKGKKKKAKKTNKSFTDSITNNTEFNAELLDRFRLNLREDSKLEFPSELSNVNFLTELGLMREGYLTAR